MDALRHLQYLEAMGIDWYVPRKPLPNARTSASVLIRKLPSPAPAEPALQQVFPSKDQNTAVKNAVLAGLKIPEASQPKTPLADAAIKAAVPPETAAFQGQIVLWMAEDLLLMVDTPRITDPQIDLLRNIVRALKRNDTLPPPQQFSWPLPQRKDRSLQAARDHFQGLLEASLLKQHAVRHIIVFGSAPLHLLAENSADKTQPWRYHNWPVCAIASLQSMLDDPTNKRSAWQALLPLVRS